MPYSNHLIGLTLPALRCPKHVTRLHAVHASQVSPEARRDAAVVWLLHDIGEFTVLNQAAMLTAKLKFVSAIIDRPRNIGLHINAALMEEDQIDEATIERLRALGYAW